MSNTNIVDTEYTAYTTKSKNIAFGDASNTIMATALVAVIVAFICEYIQEIMYCSTLVDGVRYFCLRDDAMICMRYAHNLASGIGLVWNAGEHVEGITNLGWTLIMSALHLLPISLPYVPLAVQILNLILSLIILKIIYSYLHQRTNLLISLLGVSMTAFNAPIIASGVCGFECILQSLLVTLVLLKLLPEKDNELLPFRSWCIIPWLLGIAYVVRPDTSAIFIPVVILLFVRYCREFNNSNQELLPNLIFSVVANLLLMGSILVFQHQYYGDWLPNTYYLKVVSGFAYLQKGLDYFLRFLFRDNQIIIWAGTTLFMFRGLLFSSRPINYIYSCIPIALWFTYVIAIGGDWMDLSRFFVVITPTLIVCSMLCLFSMLQAAQIGSIEDLIRPHGAIRFLYQKSPLWEKSVYASCFVMFAMTMFSIVFACRQSLAFEMEYLKQENTSLVLVARALNKSHMADGKLIGVIWAGITPYFMPNQRFHDILGKSDRYIAHTKSKWGAPGHSKWDFNYSFNKIKPDLIITNPYSMWPLVNTEMTKELQEKTDFSFCAALWFDPAFISFYQPNRVEIVTGNTRPRMQDVYLRKE